MTKQDDGGPAFPTVAGQTVHSHGMTLRDWFAGQAMAGIAGGYYGNPDMSGLTPSMMADEAYQYADAMLAARKGGV